MVLTNICIGLNGQNLPDEKIKVLQGKIVIRDIYINDTNMAKLKVVISDHRNKKYSLDLKNKLTFRFDSLIGSSWTLSITCDWYHKNTMMFLSPLTKDTTDIEIFFPVPCKYDSSFVSKKCPKCKKDDKAIPIVYGYADPESIKKDLTTFKIGGCIVSECQPRYYCKRDKLDY